MELHESLAQLAREHGESLFADADAFRGALDDYLDEGSASTGTINLLTDAVRLGALQGMVTMLDSGAGVEDAVESAGQRLSRDRGSADVTGSQWACAVLGYALGKVPVSLATRLRPDAYTAEPPSGSSGSTAARPAVSPGHVPSQPTDVAAPPQQSPVLQWPAAGAPAASAHQPPPSAPPAAQHQSGGPYGGPASPYGYTATPGYGTPPKKKSPTGLIIGAIAAVVVLGVIAVITIVALSGGDDDPSAEGGETSETTSETGGTETGGTQTGGTTAVTTDPALTLQGSGYTYQFPSEEWQDLTADTPDTTGTIDTIAAPGDDIGTARGNILVETSSAFGETDVNNLKDQWKTVLQSSTGGNPVDLEPRTIGGKEAVGVEIKWTNANDFDVHQIAYLVISGDEQYSITASFRQGDSSFQDTYYSILDTWGWEE
ncbi:hypothetical protein SFC88_21425 [Nocardioides sp. HM23]|uniref:hypothetical protein n=1 Tax=Nocardioides bizhenqiangii TaxID=3095076 RepID=UPI002ACAE185|nr:hypothetical protein [Nocardioides sp. HM23]MDZ5623408.1 hypothetical protein [Nocardioides sp. HM23]